MILIAFLFLSSHNSRTVGLALIKLYSGCPSTNLLQNANVKTIGGIQGAHYTGD
jgi:hypothetical protein